MALDRSLLVWRLLSFLLIFFIFILFPLQIFAANPIIVADVLKINYHQHTDLTETLLSFSLVNLLQILTRMAVPL